MLYSLTGKEFNMLFELKPAPLNGGFRMDGYWIWCGSVIKGEDGRYHMFASRWSKDLPMSPGWCLASEIVRAVSDTPEGPYVYEEIILPSRGPAYWDGQMTHNPQITKYKDTYILYYTGTTYPFDKVRSTETDMPLNFLSYVARSNQRVGIAIAKSINGPWKRYDEPLLKTRAGHYDEFYTSNPAPIVKSDGSTAMIYKTREYIGGNSGPMKLALANSKDPLNRVYNRPLSMPLFGTNKTEIEDPFIWFRDKRYHMIAKDMTGDICGERHGGIYASSDDAVDWKLHRNQKSYSRKVLWDDGIIREMGSLERPSLLFDENGKATHMFFATADGPGGYSIADNTWNMVIPIK